MDKIAVLIPCYNEAKTIGKVVADFKKALPEATIYVYDNNSKDNSVQIAKEAGAVVRHETRQGKGNVIKAMFREVDSRCYIMVDGDDTYPPEYAGKLCEPVLNNHTDMVIGDRLSSTYFSENKRAFHNTGNKLVRSIINVLFKSNIRDIMTGYRAFSYNFVKTFPVLSKGFEVETEMTIHSLDKNLKTESVIIDYRDRPSGSVSKLNTFSDGFKVIRIIFDLFKYYKPFFAFSFISVLLMFVAILFLIPVLIDYAAMGLVPRFPTFIASVFFVLSSILMFCTGLILDTVAKKNRQDFEIKYTECFDRYKLLMQK
jgi:glycosyltransferase involved in cell wall biosynthesis